MIQEQEKQQNSCPTPVLQRVAYNSGENLGYILLKVPAIYGATNIIGDTPDLSLQFSTLLVTCHVILLFESLFHIGYALYHLSYLNLYQFLQIFFHKTIHCLQSYPATDRNNLFLSFTPDLIISCSF